MTEHQLTETIIGAAIEVHKELGPGLLESTYETCLCHELNLQGLKFERQVTFPIIYKGLKLENDYRLDIIVEKQIILELKAAAEILPIHTAQTLTYLKLLNLKRGLILNFNSQTMVSGIKRISN